MEVQLVDSGKVVEQDPILLTTKQVGASLGYSARWVYRRRAADVKLRASGTAIVGPPWIRLGGQIRYLAAEVREWVKRNAEPCAGGEL